MTPEQRLAAIEQQVDGDELANLDPSGIVAMQLYYLIALGLNRIANHFEGINV
ncbi:hypothetical protein [Mycolicibacterium sp.]|uniref:hypothetical protein n=1 Tax=Mycolicibacterium sp. TaxID=2320850 RepID=UPI0037C59F04